MALMDVQEEIRKKDRQLLLERCAESIADRLFQWKGGKLRDSVMDMGYKHTYVCEDCRICTRYWVPAVVGSKPCSLCVDDKFLKGHWSDGIHVLGEDGDHLHLNWFDREAAARSLELHFAVCSFVTVYLYSQLSSWAIEPLKNINLASGRSSKGAVNNPPPLPPPP